MARRPARELALQALFQLDIRAQEGTPRGLVEGLLASRGDGEDMKAEPVSADELAYGKKLVDGVNERKSELDKLLDGASVNWRVVRMPVVDRNILRIACFELVALPELPASVVINEAVELAKRFGDTESKAFVNGILDRIAGETGRGGRKVRG